MKAMMMGFAVMIVISVGAYFGLQELGLTAGAVGSGDAVRLD
ncbi:MULTISPECIES: hypothetical protein [unclassified Tateyamaria]|nr:MULTISPECIES: hypothetical protein [unclassified Tateyamaria]